MTTEITRFFDPETGKQIAIACNKTVTTRDGQIWKIGSTRNGIDWAVPVGFPNAASPICRESEPDEYEQLASLEN